MPFREAIFWIMAAAFVFALATLAVACGTVIAIAVVR
jgi:hypothetical protein